VWGTRAESADAIQNRRPIPEATIAVPLRVVAIAAAAALLSLPETGPIVRTGRCYRLVCHVPDAKIAARALAVLEATWPVAMRRYGVPDRPPPQPLTVHLYRDAAQYAEAEARLTHGRFAPNLAFAHWESRTAHVAVQPELPDALLRQRGPSFQTLRLLVHEAAHLARFHAMAGYRWHPQWFADGNASWIETEVLAAQRLLTTPEECPTYSTYVVRVQDLLAARALSPLSELLADRMHGLSFYDTYAVRWLLFRFLASGEREAALRATIADMRRFGGGGDGAARAAASLRRHLGAEAWAALDDAFAAWVLALAPQWEETGRSLATASATWEQIAFADHDACAWSRACAPESEVRGELTILPCGSRQMHVLLGAEGGAAVVVAFSAGCGITVAERAGGDDTVLGALAVADLVADLPFAFRVRRLGDHRLRVDALGATLEVAVPHTLNGALGFGAAAGGAGLWRDVRRETPDGAAPAPR
jgi:hypothetical protein